MCGFDLIYWVEGKDLLVPPVSDSIDPRQVHLFPPVINTTEVVTFFNGHD